MARKPAGTAGAVLGRRGARRVATLVAAAALLGGAGCTLLGLGRTLSIQTDRSTYTLEDRDHANSVAITVRLTNDRGHAVYLHRLCGQEDHPARHLLRVSGDSTGTWISGSGTVCTSRGLVPPILVADGATYEDSFLLVASKDATGGVYRVAYDVQLHGEVEGWGPAEPVLSREATTSNSFTIRPPDSTQE